MNIRFPGNCDKKRMALGSYFKLTLGNFLSALLLIKTGLSYLRRVLAAISIVLSNESNNFREEKNSAISLNVSVTEEKKVRAGCLCC